MWQPTEGTLRQILDLGCGTGLSGSALANAGLTTSSDAHLTGVDISVESLDVAHAKGVYDKLVQVCLCI